MSFVGDAMQLDAGGEIFRMRSVVAASGAKYQAEDDPSTIFWNKGREAFIQIRGQALGTCAIAAAASIEPAASQTPLRARGNEPGWNLTIGDAEIALVTDYGANALDFPEAGAGSIRRRHALRGGGRQSDDHAARAALR